MILSGRISASTMTCTWLDLTCAANSVQPRWAQCPRRLARTTALLLLVEQIGILEHPLTFNHGALRIGFQQTAPHQVVMAIHRARFVAVQAPTVAGERNEISHIPLPRGRGSDHAYRRSGISTIDLYSGAITCSFLRRRTAAAPLPITAFFKIVILYNQPFLSALARGASSLIYLLDKRKFDMPHTDDSDRAPKPKRPVSEGQASGQPPERTEIDRAADRGRKTACVAQCHSPRPDRPDPYAHFRGAESAPGPYWRSRKAVSPGNAQEKHLVHMLAQLQYRLHRIMATEHNLFAIGLIENSEFWDVNHPEAQTAFVLAETLRRSKDPLLTLSIYEQRLMRQYEKTLKMLREVQADRKAQERASRKRSTKSACVISSPARSSRRPSLASFVRKRKPRRSSSANGRSNTLTTPIPGTSIANPAGPPSPSPRKILIPFVTSERVGQTLRLRAAPSRALPILPNDGRRRPVQESVAHASACSGDLQSPGSGQ